MVRYVTQSARSVTRETRVRSWRECRFQRKNDKERGKYARERRG
jgi:hypothetical protein